MSKVLQKKLKNKTISLKNRLEDMKSLYEDIILVEKNNFINKNYHEIIISENEKITLVKWSDKSVYDFSHYIFNKEELKGAFELNETINILAIYNLFFGMITSEDELMKKIYK